MDIKAHISPERPNRYDVTFTPEEANVISAAYSEEVYERASKANSSNEFAATTAMWGDKKSRKINVDEESVASIDGVLKRFHERTLEVVAELPEITGVPAFINEHIGLRQTLGAAAAKLAEEFTGLVVTEKDAADILTMPEAKGRRYPRKRRLFR
ncbi:MAG TPA: hypothetical protein VMR95_00960 [Candidatus Binatia bacterium]|nr:hypothetical protein [Candidatus Binatia bacterium]